MIIREPVVAGQFYPSQPDRCHAEVAQYLKGESPDLATDKPLVGGLVPHAGWMCSGAVAGQVPAWSLPIVRGIGLGYWSNSSSPRDSPNSHAW